MEALRIGNVDIDIRKHSLVSTPSFVQNDSNVIRVSIYDNGEPADLSNIGKVVVNYKRPDRQIISRELTRSNNVVDYKIGLPEMEKVGVAQVELQLYDLSGSTRLSLFRFSVNIVDEIGTQEVREDNDEVTLLQEIFMEVEDIRDYSLTQAEAAKKAAESAVTNWKQPVANKAAVDALPSPKLGDTVQTNDNGYVYRYDGKAWVKTQEYGATALANVNAQLAKKANESEVRKTSIPIGLNDASAEMLAAIQGGQSTPFNVLSIPRTGSVSVEKTDFLKPVKNLFNGQYIAGIINGDKTNGGVFNASPTGRSVIVPVKPFTTYSILKGQSERFRVALHDKIPAFGESLKRYDKDSSVADSPFALRGIYRTYTLTTRENENYMIIYLSADLSEQPIVQVEEAASSSQYDPYAVKLGFDISTDKEFLSKNIVKSKNLFNGQYSQGILTGSVGTPSEFRVDATGRVAILPVKVGETYTISKKASNRFRIAVTKGYPNATIAANFLVDSANDSKSEATVTIPNDYSYLVVYVSGNNTPTPEFMQIERGANRTSWETYGYKFSEEAKSKSTSTRLSPEDFGAVGDGITDDTSALQSYLDSYVGVFELSYGKTYLVSQSLNFPVFSAKVIKGNNAKIVANGDFPILNVYGNQIGSADPSVSGENVKNEKGAIIDGVRFSSTSGVDGTAISVRNTFGLMVKNCNMHFMKKGIEVNKINRNMIFDSNHIYAMSTYGIHFTPDGDLHQINIVNNHISYCKCIIYVDDQGMYNMQITGNDLETSLYPECPTNEKFNLHFRSKSRMMEDIEIVGNTIEDHWYSDEMVKFDGETYESIMEITMTGNVIGNGKRDVLSLKGISRSSFVGNTLKKYDGYGVKINGDLESFIFEGNSISPQKGGFIKCQGDFYFKQVSLSNNVMALTPSANAIDIAVRSIQGTKICGNAVTLSSLANYDDTKALFQVTGTSSIKRSLFNDNILTSYNDPVACVMRVKAPTVSKVSVKNNMSGGVSDNTVFDLPTANSNVFVSENV